jgi:hypothetical protein
MSDKMGGVWEVGGEGQVVTRYTGEGRVGEMDSDIYPQIAM